MNQCTYSKSKHCSTHTRERACAVGVLLKQTVRAVTNFGLHVDVCGRVCTGWMTIFTSLIPEQTPADTQTRKV